MRWWSSLFGQAQEQATTPEIGSAPHIEQPVATPRRTAHVLPRFRGTAVDRVAPSTSSYDQLRLRLRAAFTPARPVMDPTRFAGRGELLRTVIRAVEDQYLHVVLFGPRGIGKTSTLHVLCGIARESRYLVRYVSCGERSNFDALFRAILADTPLLFHDSYDPTANEIESGLSFKDLLDDQPLTVDLVSDIFDRLAGTRLLVVLDEFDRAGDADLRRSIAELIKNLSDRGSRVQLIIAGVAQNLTEIIEHVPSIRRNILGLLLPNMTQDEIADLINAGQQASGMSFTPKALQLISLAALGLPYLASLIAQHAGFAALERRSDRVDHNDVERGMGQVLDHLQLRIAPSTRLRVDEAIRDGHERALGSLAQVSLINSFRLPVAQIPRDPAGQPNTSALLQPLHDRYGLIVLVVDEPDTYVFSDDGVPLFLWVRLMLAHARSCSDAAT